MYVYCKSHKTKNEVGARGISVKEVYNNFYKDISLARYQHMQHFYNKANHLLSYTFPPVYVYLTYQNVENTSIADNVNNNIT